MNIPSTHKTYQTAFSYYHSPGYRMAHRALCEYYSWWVSTPKDQRNKKFTVNENVASSMLKKALDIDSSPKTNKPFADLVWEKSMSIEIKCLFSKVKKKIFGSAQMFVLTRAAFVDNARSMDPDVATAAIIEQLNRIIRQRYEETQQGVRIHYFIYDEGKVLHFEKPLVELDPAKYTAKWKDKGRYSTLLVNDRETGKIVFSYTVNGSKIQFYSGIPPMSECTIFDLIEIGRAEMIFYDNVDNILLEAANNASQIYSDYTEENLRAA